MDIRHALFKLPAKPPAIFGFEVSQKKNRIIKKSVKNSISKITIGKPFRGRAFLCAML